MSDHDFAHAFYAPAGARLARTISRTPIILEYYPNHRILNLNNVKNYRLWY